MSQEENKGTNRLRSLPCACANLRRASRAVTQLYDRELKPAGLRSTQFTLLQVLSALKKVRQGRLGDLLALDSTTLSRSLKPLEKRKWIRSAEGEDRRERYWELTDRGLQKMVTARPLWEKVQIRLRKELGDQDWEALREILERTARGAKA